MKPYHYSDFEIKSVVDRLFELSFQNKTPRKYKVPMFEAAEIIRQLLKEGEHHEEHHTEGSE